MEKDVKHKVENEEDFCYCPRLENSIKKVLETNPRGIKDGRIAKLLLLDDVEEVEAIYQRAIEKLRKLMGVEL